MQCILYECSFSYVQNMERVHEDLMRDVTELQQQLQSSSQQLRRKEAELTRAEETIRREQQQIQEMVSRPWRILLKLPPIFLFFYAHISCLFCFFCAYFSFKRAYFSQHNKQCSLNYVQQIGAFCILQFSIKPYSFL